MNVRSEGNLDCLTSESSSMGIWKRRSKVKNCTLCSRSEEPQEKVGGSPWKERTVTNRRKRFFRKWPTVFWKFCLAVGEGPTAVEESAPCSQERALAAWKKKNRRLKGGVPMLR